MNKLFLPVVFLILLAGCQAAVPVVDDMVIPAIELVVIAPGEKLAVIATTSIIGDVVAQVGGDAIDLITLMPLGQNPHSYEPTPDAFAAIERADLIFVNGLGLEEALLTSLSGVAKGVIVPLSAGITILEGGEAHDEEETQDEGDDHAEGDPHFWVDPNNVMVWVENAWFALSAADPSNAEIYRANADAYIAELVALDAAIRQQVETIPPADRKLVTDHTTFTYFADEYGFELIGAIIPSFTTTSGASAGDIANLVEIIRAEEVPAIFISATADQGIQSLAQTVAAESGVEISIIPLLEGSLAPAGERGDTYLDFMAYNVEQIISGLQGG